MIHLQVNIKLPTNKRNLRLIFSVKRKIFMDYLLRMDIDPHFHASGMQ